MLWIRSSSFNQRELGEAINIQAYLGGPVEIPEDHRIDEYLLSDERDDKRTITRSDGYNFKSMIFSSRFDIVVSQYWREMRP